MRLSEAQDNLRRIIWQRLWQGELTQLQLAGRTGFRQAHISNFLSGKRRLSLEGLDQMLSALGLSVSDLLASEDGWPGVSPAADPGYENVPLVEAETAAAAVTIGSEQALDLLKFKKAFLRRLRAD